MEQELSGPAALSFWDDWRVTNQPQQRTKRARFKKAWNLQEHARFLEALNMHGKGKWRDIAAWVGTRSAAQCQSHAQKFFDREQVRHQEHAHTEFADLPCSRAPLARKLRKRSIHDIRDPLLIRKELARQEDEQRAREERHARRAAAHERKLLHAKVSFIETRLRGHIERFVREHALTSPTKRLASNLRSNVQKCTQEWKASHMREQLASIEHASDKSETCGTEEELVPVVVMVPEDSLPTETKVFHLRKPLVLNMSDDAVSDTLDSHR
jgi:SHAQKYF class myb-like DNA-binding protein